MRADQERQSVRELLRYRVQISDRASASVVRARSISRVLSEEFWVDYWNRNEIRSFVTLKRTDLTVGVGNWCHSSRREIKWNEREDDRRSDHEAQDAQATDCG